MSVVAYKDHIMAADTGGCSFGGLYKKIDKLWRKDDIIIGIAGTWMDGAVFKDWYFAGANPERLPQWVRHDDKDAPDFQALVLDVQGCHIWQQHFVPEPVDDFFAIGQGAPAAVTAMHMGANAIEACEIACTVNFNCRAPIVYEILK